MTINVKSIQDIMRKDDGVDGDAQRISQLVWLIFLKIYDDKEKEYEIMGDYVSPIPEKLRWRNWAEDREGITGEELLNFVNDELFPGLQELDVEGESSPLASKISSLFQDTYNYMKSGTLLRQVINIVNDIDFNDLKDRHIFNDVYEKILNDLQSAGNAGEYYTPRPVTKFMVDMIDPKLGEIVFDPACGTGGFLINALEHVRAKYVKNTEDEKSLQNSIRGIEKKPLPYLLSITNMILHNVELPQIDRMNTLGIKPYKDYGKMDEVDIILANPPFGGDEESGVMSNFPKSYSSVETADLFLLLFVRMLKEGGRAAIVLPDGNLFSEGRRARIKEKLMEECNLHTIVRLPKNVFAPYTDIATNILFFEKGKPTEEVWFFEHPVPGDRKNYSKTKPIKDEEFALEKEWWNNREGNEYAWKVSIEDIKDRDYNLDIKNPNKETISIGFTPEEGISRLKNKVVEMNKLIENLEKMIDNKKEVEFDFIELSELLQRSNNKIELKDEETYSQVTVRLWGKGIEERNKVLGAEIGTKTRQVVEENQFILSKIDARSGAYGIIPPELTGAVVSSDFPVYDINTERVVPEYVDWISKTLFFMEQCKSASSGTTNRIRLKEDRFLKIKIPVPKNLEGQQEIINQMKSCQKLGLELEETQSIKETLMQVILHELFLTKDKPSEENNEELEDTLVKK